MSIALVAVEIPDCLTVSTEPPIMLFILPIMLCCTAQTFCLLCSVYPYTSDKALDGQKMHIGWLVATFLSLTVHCLKPLTLLHTVYTLHGKIKAMQHIVLFISTNQLHNCTL